MAFITKDTLLNGITNFLNDHRFSDMDSGQFTKRALTLYFLKQNEEALVRISELEESNKRQKAALSVARVYFGGQHTTKTETEDCEACQVLERIDAILNLKAAE